MNKIEKELAQRMIDMVSKEKKIIDSNIRYNASQIKKYSQENTILKRQRVPLTEILNEWMKIKNNQNKGEK